MHSMPSTDEPVEEQARSFQAFLEQVEEELGVHIEPGPATDVVVGASGAFGVDATSPIPVNGTEGMTVYLNLLRSHTGSEFVYHRPGSVTAANGLGLARPSIDIVELCALDRSWSGKLHFSIYFPRRSRITPGGLRLASWQELSGEDQALYTLDHRGLRMAVAGFPAGLPDALRQSAVRQRLSPDEGALMYLIADKVKKALATRGMSAGVFEREVASNVQGNSAVAAMIDGVKGRRFGELVLHHVSKMSAQQILEALGGLTAELDEVAGRSVEAWVDEINPMGLSRAFWRADADKVLEDLAGRASRRLRELGVSPTDDELASMVQVIISNFAYTAHRNPQSKSFIQKAVGIGFLGRLMSR